MNYLPILNNELHKYGFKLLFNDTRDQKGLSFIGFIFTHKKIKLEIELYFKDKSLTQFPKAFIRNYEQCKLSPYHSPHFDGSHELCYEDGSNVFDKYDIPLMIRYVFDSIIDVVDNNNKDDMKEIIREFSSYWNYSFLYYGNIDEANTSIFFKKNKVFNSINNIWGIELSDLIEYKYFIINSIPSIKDITWPLTTIADFKTWMSSENIWPSINTYIHNCIIKYLSIIPIVLYSIKDDLYFGFNIEINYSFLGKNRPKKLQNSTIKCLMNKILLIKDRFWVDNYSTNSIINANNKIQHDFINKKILIIGVGTIGSNLLNILIKNGAGLGSDGYIKLVDFDIYKPYNYSRHSLGLNSSGLNKTKVLAMECKYNFPSIKIDTSEDSIVNIYSIMSDFDIIIDTTGEESLTMFLNEKIHIINMKKDFIFISTWIKGMGDFAECFVKTEQTKGCHECLRRNNEYDKIENTEIHLRDSCRSIYIPFPITASMYASLLVMQILIDYSSIEILYTNYYYQKLKPVGEIKSELIKSFKDCPVCGMNYIKE